MDRMSAVVVGGGMAGLCTAYALVQAGQRPLVLDAGQPGQGTSWAAAGMLAPIHELEPTELPLLAAGRASLSLHADWARLLADLGHDVHLRTNGTLEVALTRDDVPWLRRHHDFQRQQGLDVHWLAGAAIREHEPALAPTVPAAIFAPKDWQVDQRRLLPALVQAIEHGGGEVRADTPVERIETDAPGYRLLTPQGAIQAQTVVVATGAAPVPWPQPQAILPLRGQMLSLEPPPGGLVQRVVRIRSRTFGNAYLVPKHDRIILGSTSEDMGHDARLTAGGLLDILRKTYAAVPGLYDLPILATWAGLRPATPSRQPHLIETQPGLWHLNGLYRHGILLGPLLGSAAAAAVLGQAMPEAARPFVQPLRTHHA